MSPKFELPPSIAGKVKDSRHRSRDRIRFEVAPEQGRWLSTLIEASIKGLDIEDPNFRTVYQLYRSLNDQLDKLKPKE